VPIVTINLLDSWKAKDEKAISKTIHNAIVEVFQVPENDFNHRILRFNRDSWQLPPGKSERYLLVEMDLFPGRRSETKAKLYHEIVSRLHRFGTPENEIIIIIREPPLENWGIRGGKAANAIDLEYDLNV
jgi:phenylpyruvate tautomerase PptA (4-oxalocrotonate tautomerase family)